MRVKPGKNGFFVHPLIYNLAKKAKTLKDAMTTYHFMCEKKTFNIRSSFYINRIRYMSISVHNGRETITSHPFDFRNNKYTFRIGQVTYNRHLPQKRTVSPAREYVALDLKKKKAEVLKVSRRKKYVYFESGASS